MSLRKKILAFDEGMTVYSHLEKDEEDITISFAQSLYITATKICELLPEYLEDLAHGECKEALGIDYDKMTSMAYWMKNGKLKADMMALSDLTLKERGIEFAYKGFKPKTTWELYEAIEQKVAGMVEMIKEVKQRIKAAPPFLYGNFFRYQKSLCDRRSVEARYARWKRDIGVPNIELLKDKEAQEVVDFLKKKVFQHIKEPSTREVGLVDLNSLSEHMPEGNTFPDEFPHCYTRFLRYAKVEDGIYHINYNAYGQYLFDFYYLLTPDERQAFIELDIMLDLIHQDMMLLKEVILPEPLATPEAMVLWRKAQDASWVDERFQSKLSLTKSAMLASEMAVKLDIKDRWKYYEQLWNRKNMRSHYSNALLQPNSYEFLDEIKKVLG